MTTPVWLTGLRAIGLLACPGLLVMIRSALGMLSGNTRWIVSAHSPTFLWIAASVWLAIAWVLTTLVVLLFRAAPANTRVERIGVAVVGALVVLALGLTAFADIS